MDVWTPDGAFEFGRQQGLQEGILLGRAMAWEEAFRVTAEQQADHEPTTVVAPAERERPPGRPGLTGAQLVAGARWSWSRVERAIAAQSEQPAGNVQSKPPERDRHPPSLAPHRRSGSRIPVASP